MNGIRKQFRCARMLCAATALLAMHGMQAMAATSAVVLTPPVKKPDAAAYFTSQFFGMHIHQADNPADWPQFGVTREVTDATTGVVTKKESGKIGAFRFWDGAGTWAEVQPTAGSAFDFTRADLYVSKVSAAGARSLLTLGRTPAWASARPSEASAYGPGMAAEAADINQWRAYVRAMATRYRGKIEAYQVWNEANTTPFYTGTTANLVKLMCAAYDEIKKADPAALVVSPSGVGAWDTATIWVKQVLDAGGAKCIDIVAYHLYTGGSAPENFVVPMMSMQAQLYKAGYQFRYWNTETGYLAPNSSPTAMVGWSAYELRNKMDDATAANYTVRAMLLARALGFERFYWYSWDNARLGFTDPVTFRERTNAVFLRQFDAWFDGAKLKGCNRTVTGVWTCSVTFAEASIFSGKSGSVIWVDPAADLQTQTISVLKGAVLQFDPTRNPALAPSTLAALPAMSNMTVGPTPQLLLWK